MTVESKRIRGVLEILKKSSLKLTKQRKYLIEIIFRDGDGHYTAEDIFKKTKKTKIKISLATVYNTLNSFKRIGVLGTVKTSTDKIYFDTNLNTHHHFFFNKSNELVDIDASQITISKLPKIPSGKKINSVNVIIDLDEKND